VWFLICISFMVRDTEHFFMYFFGHLDFFLRKSSVSTVAYFFIGSLISQTFSFLSCLYILVISPLSDV
jgi:hypothetical protein